MGSGWKALASALLIAHFAAILSAALAQPMPGQPAPYLAVKLHDFFKPYLGALFLDSSFRFYAPNPGPVKLCWLRIERESGAAEWIEFPRRRGIAPWPRYHRELAVVAFWDAHIGPHPGDSKRLMLTAAGKIGIGSFIRKMAANFDRHHDHVRAVDFYIVHHRALEPGQIADGWHAYDLRLYRICQVGRFLANGQAADELAPAAIESSRVAARALTDVRIEQGKERNGCLAQGPRAVTALLEQHAELAAAVAVEDELKQRIERVSVSGLPTGLSAHAKGWR